MIQRLRRKFIIINMSLVAAVLVTVFAAMALTTLRQTNSLIDEALSNTLNRHMDEAPVGPEIGKRTRGGEPFASRGAASLPVFCVQLDETGAVEKCVLQNATVSDEVVAAAAARAVAAGKNTGTLKEYDLRYLIRYSSEGTKIAFADLTGSRQTLTRQLVMLLCAGAGGLVLFFLISLGLSNWALRPVAQSWERQRQFVADASHELKTPLTVVLANTDIVLSHARETVAEQARWLDSTKTESLRMKELVDDMLFLARADLAAPPAMEVFSLSDAMWSASLPFEAVAFEAGVRLDTAGISSGVQLYGNRQQIERMIAVLLDNAVQYAGGGGTVTASLAAGSDGICLRVHNSGEPIAPEQLPHLFERFYRADAARANDGGYGLGLAIAKSIAEVHRANIVVTSNNVSGTAFCVEWREHHALAG